MSLCGDMIQMTPCVAEIISYYDPPVISDLPRHRKQVLLIGPAGSAQLQIRISSLWRVIEIAKLTGLNTKYNMKYGGLETKMKSLMT